MQIVCYKTAFTIRCDTTQCASIKREIKLSPTYDTHINKTAEQQGLWQYWRTD